MSSFLDLLNPERFSLTTENLKWFDEKTLIVKKWNWDYLESYAFQKEAVRLLQDFPKFKVLICTSHPQLFTNGRGLQKPRKGEVLELKDFNPEDQKLLPFPFHQIERGGGLTFHHPGQFVFYPIVKLNPSILSLSHLIDSIFAAAAGVLNDWGLNDLDSTHKLLGLWHRDQKLASMGIAIEKLTTFHGMALNLFSDEKMKDALRRLNPCGLNASTYTSVSELMSLNTHTHDEFAEKFLTRLTHGW